MLRPSEPWTLILISRVMRGVRHIQLIFYSQFGAASYLRFLSLKAILITFGGEANPLDYGQNVGVKSSL